MQATDAVVAAARNHSVGTARRGQRHRFVEERPTAEDRAARAGTAATARATGRGDGRTEPLAGLQWDMAQIGATPAGAHATATGKGVTVGILDTGVDASHPDIAPNFDAALSRNFTMDIPSLDGEWEVPTCIDPANVDEGGHGTHVAGIVAAARNGLGTAGTAPDATIVNVRAGQDSGYFFLYETVAALTYPGEVGLDVINSYYVVPWLYNCDSPGDYVSGPVTEEELAQQAFIKQTVTAALEYAQAHGVTLVASAFYTYLQGTSMAGPHVAGLATLVIEAHGGGDHRHGYSLDPETVQSIIETTATDTPCPPGGVDDYTDEGRPPSWNATCVGTTVDNGFFGEGIVYAAAAVAG